MSVLAYPLALAAAAMFAVAIPLEHRSADRAPEAAGLAPRQIGAFVRGTLRDPWWLGGMGLSTLGFALHAFALRLGGLSVVQPLLVSNLIFALLANRWLRREAIRPVELAWAAALGLALSGFLLVATAGVPVSSEAADRGPAIGAGILTALVTGGLVLASRRAGRSGAATILGIATGVLFAVTASLIKECTGLITRGAVPLLSSWQLYALLVMGGVGLLNQLAYQAGPLSASLPAITVIDPLVAVLLGVTIFRREPAAQPAGDRRRGPVPAPARGQRGPALPPGTRVLTGASVKTGTEGTGHTWTVGGPLRSRRRPSSSFPRTDTHPVSRTHHRTRAWVVVGLVASEER